MDKDGSRRMEKGGVSAIQGEELLLNKFISRNSSVGCSSRIYYYRSSEGIPFNWEMQPGTPKEPQKEDIVPPISPPPAVLSLAFPKPCIKVEDPKPRMKLRFKFWKHGKKKPRAAAGSKLGENLDVTESEKNWNNNNNNIYEMCSSDDGEFMASPRMSSSSSSSSFSFSNGLSFRSSRFPNPPSSLHKHYGCSPLKFSSTLVRVSKLRRL